LGAIIVKNTMPAPGPKIHTKAGPTWKKHYSFIPRKINGKWYWLSYVYRYYTLSPGGGFWKYGDSFDALRNI